MRTGYCFCGALRIDVHGDPLGTGICHCLACQRRTGSVFATLAAFAAPWTVTGAFTEYLHTGDAGGTARFHFCPTCGTSLFHTDAARPPTEVLVAVGAFADPSFPPPSDSVYTCRRHAWVTLPPDIIAYDKDPT